MSQLTNTGFPDAKFVPGAFFPFLTSAIKPAKIDLDKSIFFCHILEPQNIQLSVFIC